MTDKIKNLLVRTASGAVLVVVVFGAVLWARWSWGALLALLTVGGMAELYALARKCGAEPQLVIGTVAGLGVLAIACCSETCGGGWYGLLLLLPLAFICELWRRSETPIANVSATIAGVVYIVLPLSLLPYIVLMLSHGGVWNALVLLGYMLLVWGNDVFAYLAGVMFGRHKMFERISPKKSWEGFAGGIAGAVLIGLAVCRFIESDWSLWCGLAVVVAVSGVAGDLVESMFKRSVGVKDSGNILPGHGGWLDRFDALLISVPFAFVYTILWCACCK